MPGALRHRVVGKALVVVEVVHAGGDGELLVQLVLHAGVHQQVAAVDAVLAGVVGGGVVDVVGLFAAVARAQAVAERFVLPPGGQQGGAPGGDAGVGVAFRSRVFAVAL